jgi:hypothetical protein
MTTGIEQHESLIAQKDCIVILALIRRDPVVVAPCPIATIRIDRASSRVMIGEK